MIMASRFHAAGRFVRFFIVVIIVLVAMTFLDDELALRVIKMSGAEVETQAVKMENTSNMGPNTTDPITVSSFNNNKTNGTKLSRNDSGDMTLVNSSLAPIRETKRENITLEQHNVTNTTTTTVVEGSNATSEVVVSANSTTTTTLLVQLGGEMCNNLWRIAYARGVQLMAQEKKGIQLEIVLRHQNAGKWGGAMRNAKKGFPSLRPLDFSEGNTQQVDEQIKQQKEWLGQDDAEMLELKVVDGNCKEDCIETALANLQHIQKRQDRPKAIASTLTLPFLYSEEMINYFITDRYYEDFRTYFAFDHDKNCKLQPDPDESVFHFRNFLIEMPKVGQRMGFEELSPNKTATEMFRDLKPGDKVAITTRIGGARVQEYVTALEARGLIVRVLQGQSTNQDFCFLLHSQKEFVGSAVSTFAFWAGYLGNAKKVRLYSVASPDTQRRRGDNMFIRYNWTNEVLKSKITFELYKSEAADKLAANKQ